MIAYVVPVQGDDAVGLMRYLFGPGRHNEHEGQRVIACSPVAGIVDVTPLDLQTQRQEIVNLGRDLDCHRKALGVTRPGGHMWHCAISLRPEEALTDVQWAEVARDIVHRLGFDGGQVSPCEWVAVHHGMSRNGSEHIHLAVNLVRQDGTFASIYRDWPKLSQLCAEFETRYGHAPVSGRAGAGQPGLTRAEIEITARKRKPEHDRTRLARLVRAAAAVETEAEFLDRLRDTNVLVKARYAPDGRHTVTGYSVALRPAGQDEPVWYGGGKLSPDLSLPRLRDHWTANPANAVQALDRWHRPHPAHPAPTERAPLYADLAWEQAAQVVAGVRLRLAQVPPDDSAAWAAVARETAGILAVWSVRIEPHRPGPLAETARVLARSAQTKRHQPRPRSTGPIRDLRGVAMVIHAASNKGKGPRGQLVLLRQIIRMMNAIAEAAQARGDAQHAIQAAAESRDALLRVLQVRTTRLSNSMPPPSVGGPPAPGRGFGIG